MCGHRVPGVALVRWKLAGSPHRRAPAGHPGVSDSDGSHSFRRSQRAAADRTRPRPLMSGSSGAAAALAPATSGGGIADPANVGWVAEPSWKAAPRLLQRGLVRDDSCGRPGSSTSHAILCIPTFRVCKRSPADRRPTWGPVQAAGCHADKDRLTSYWPQVIRDRIREVDW